VGFEIRDCFKGFFESCFLDSFGGIGWMLLTGLLSVGVTRYRKTAGKWGAF
jgi:hypothetical protein